MQVHDEGAAEGGYANANSKFKREIKTHLRAEVDDLDTLKRTADNVIGESESFHYDARMLNSGVYKFDVQFRKGAGPAKQKTVAVVLIEPDATSVQDFHTCIDNALDGTHEWQVC